MLDASAPLAGQDPAPGREGSALLPSLVASNAVETVQPAANAMPTGQTIPDGPEWSVLLINPNTSQWVTDKLAAHLGRLLGPAVRIEPVTARFGEPYIASRPAFEVAERAVVDALAMRLPPGSARRFDAVLIGCFGDPGLAQLRLQTDLPVLGLAEAAVGEAWRVGRYAIVTGGKAWKPMLEEIVAGFGWSDRLDNITVIEQSGADLAADPEGAQRLLAAACREAAAPGVHRVVLGGAGFAGYGDVIAAQVPVPVIDSVSAAARALAALWRS
jgi:Asp/Glu/hydantoin racemase